MPPLNRQNEEDHGASGRAEPIGAPRVLVVDDDPVVAQVIERVLTRKGFLVDVAADGRVAAQIMHTLPPPAVVVLDVMLPFVGGFELVEQMRHSPQWADVPILMLTSKANESYVTRAFGAGVDDYVTKPFSPDELVARVRHLARV
jgi:DNA-binding response OmpR family regulator